MRIDHRRGSHPWRKRTGQEGPLFLFALRRITGIEHRGSGRVRCSGFTTGRSRLVGAATIDRSIVPVPIMLQLWRRRIVRDRSAGLLARSLQVLIQPGHAVKLLGRVPVVHIELAFTLARLVPLVKQITSEVRRQTGVAIPLVVGTLLAFVLLRVLILLLQAVMLFRR